MVAAHTGDSIELDLYRTLLAHLTGDFSDNVHDHGAKLLLHDLFRF